MSTSYEVKRAVIRDADLMWLKEGGSGAMFLKLSFNTSSGRFDYSIHMDKMQRLFKVLNITHFNEIIGRPCLILFFDGFFRDIGYFLYQDIAELSHDRLEKTTKENDEKCWVYNVLANENVSFDEYTYR